jgi:hypothetical protein
VQKSVAKLLAKPSFIAGCLVIVQRSIESNAPDANPPTPGKIAAKEGLGKVARKATLATNES